MNTAQKNGYLTEELFVVECIKRNIAISRPMFNTEPYDFICEVNNCFVSVQVKKTWVEKQKNRHVACLRSCYPGSKIRKIVSENQRVDFIALYDFGDWYIIPRIVISHIRSNICVAKNGKYGKYLNNFDMNNDID